MAETRVVLECEGCGSDFSVKPYREDSAKFCSRECRRDRITLTCEWCDGEYEEYPYREDESRFCSTECKGEWQSEEMVGEDAPHWKGGNPTLECDWCDDDFEARVASGGHQGRFCSQDCYSKWSSENLVGEDHHLYEGGPQRYAPGWDRQRKRARERDFQQCFLCSMPSGAHKVAYGSDIEVHHVKAHRDGGSHDLSNLISLCTTCHNRMESSITPS